jgi:hypothetical protein
MEAQARFYELRLTALERAVSVMNLTLRIESLLDDDDPRREILRRRAEALEMIVAAMDRVRTGPTWLPLPPPLEPGPE